MQAQCWYTSTDQSAQLL